MLLPVEHRPSTSFLQADLSRATLSISPHDFLMSFASAITDLLQVSMGLPRFLWPCGFHVRACLAVLVAGRLRVCPIHFRLLVLISSPIGTIRVFSHRSLLLTISNHLSPRICLRHLLMELCSFCSDVVVSFQVSDP